MSILLQNVKILGEEEGYVLVRGNRIEKVGTGDVPGASRAYDLEGALLLPGFCDSHTHLENIALMHGTLDLTGLEREDILARVREECRRKRVVVGRGWDESTWRRKEYLIRGEIDEVCSDGVVFLIREDGHIAVVNSAARKKYGLGDDDGLLREDEVKRMIDLLGVFRDLDFEYAQNYALSKGITCVHDFASPDTLREYLRMHREEGLKLRIYANFYEDFYDTVKSLGLHSGFGDAFLRIGALKIFADGSIGAKTAATKYADGTVVEPLLRAGKIRKIVNDANSHGIRVFTHAIGDAAIDEVVRAYRGTEGNRIEHFELALNEHMLEGLEVSMQPNFLKWAKRGGLYHTALGEDVLERNNRYRDIIKAGMTLLFGSDCMPLDPLFGIRMATGSEYGAQRVSWREAIKAYTRGSKYMHPLLGEIVEGAIADLVAVGEGKVIMTMVNGKMMHLEKNLNGK